MLPYFPPILPRYSVDFSLPLVTTARQNLLEGAVSEFNENSDAVQSGWVQEWSWSNIDDRDPLGAFTVAATAAAD